MKIESHSPAIVALLCLTIILALFAHRPIRANSPVINQTSAEFYDLAHIEVKFSDSYQIRLRNGALQALGNSVNTTQTQQQLSDLDSLGKWSRTHEVPESYLDQLHQQGQTQSRTPISNLNSFFRLKLASSKDGVAILTQLQQLESIESAEFVPLPPPLPTVLTPPNYNVPNASGSYQWYQDAAPDGIDARYAWSQGVTGNGVKICDVEYSVNVNHQDLPPITIARTGTDPFNDTGHGTAVSGEMHSENNGFGTTGIAYDTGAYFSHANAFSGYNPAAAITACANAMNPGDVILLEQQANGPEDKYIPVEWVLSVYNAIKTVTAAGYVVVEAAGNGSADLNSTAYNVNHAPFLPQNDSGAIIVGAAYHAGAAVPRSAASFSTYGSRLNLQGWGDWSVVTTGYGSLYSAEGEQLWYSNDFSGTSSASPIVAGAAALLQAAYKAKFGEPASPAWIRQTLIDTGTPQQGTKHIGPQPNLRAALQYLDSLPAGTPTSTATPGGPTSTPTPTKTATATPSGPTSTPTPTNTPLPTATPNPGSCSAPAWNAATTYLGDAGLGANKGEVVSYNNRQWRAKWWTQNNEPGIDQVWLDLGPCAIATPTPTNTTVPPTPTPTETALPPTPTPKAVVSAENKMLMAGANTPIWLFANAPQPIRRVVVDVTYDNAQLIVSACDSAADSGEFFQGVCDLNYARANQTIHADLTATTPQGGENISLFNFTVACAEGFVGEAVVMVNYQRVEDGSGNLLTNYSNQNGSVTCEAVPTSVRLEGVSADSRLPLYRLLFLITLTLVSASLLVRQSRQAQQRS